MKTPKPLNPGDAVGIVATARKVSEAEIAPAFRQIEKWGYRPVAAPHLFAEKHQMAGTPKQRTKDFQNFLNDGEIKAILCARGGYGTVQIIDDLDFSTFVKNPKWVTGYSDVTVLHNTINNLGIESIHGPMAFNFAREHSSSLHSLRQIWQGERPPLQFKPQPFQVSGSATGTLLGGNLSMLYSQTGSFSALQTDNAILFMEDLDEYLYHIDRMMMNLTRNHYFRKAAGFITGTLSDMNDNSIPFGETATQIIHRHLHPLSKPLAMGAPAGHCNPNMPLIMGATVSLTANEHKAQLEYV